MEFQQIRNATSIIDYAGKRFLIDPMLADKESFPGFPGTMNSHLSNPLVELPIPMDEILDVDAVIVTHTHPDHWDDAAKSWVPKDMFIFAQNEKDAEEMHHAGFNNVHILDNVNKFGDIKLFKTSGQHGNDKAIAAIGDMLGNVCGIVFSHQEEKTLYLAGDTIWNDHVVNSINTYNPQIIIVNSGAAKIEGLGAIIMDKEDVLAVVKAAPEATIIASHMEAVNHAMLSRSELHNFLEEKGVVNHVFIPEDGEVIHLSK